MLSIVNILHKLMVLSMGFFFVHLSINAILSNIIVLDFYSCVKFELRMLQNCWKHVLKMREMPFAGFQV